ncbi:hypothetical protein GT037_009461 [Alternaria burnsii]|uniref:Heterokaryon incompatibility domain-containing protein n=1 Tax=Alternaria burnsii TaxID=1187904 RepID=A0A8H7B0I8_9PLEO|nr:uncharacterized protein GT037_009461 [Alternaria burnsii]KAF7672430.1 hypothetical protein GT037_009461 [Alternaria burnsii]CAI9632849.1 unnamed protein product [Alternaria burnsii]
MRLLQRLPGSSDFSLVERFGEEIPPYAILSHTWGSDEDEVTFSGLRDTLVKKKAGYSKLSFCSHQAAQDELDFFWVDTCCIDKSSSAELSEAINSMFKWYQKAAKCYVLLTDVLIDLPARDVSQQHWAQIFQKSRWFQRGWTLQELLAPRVVEFFSKAGTRLGDRTTLLQALHSRTQIPILALQGAPLLQFSIAERMSWFKGRRTKREEDEAYCLLGLLGVFMPSIYGEGRQSALARLQREARASQQTMPLDSLHHVGQVERSDSNQTSLSKFVGEIPVRNIALSPFDKSVVLNDPDVLHRMATAIENLYGLFPASRITNIAQGLSSSSSFTLHPTSHSTQLEQTISTISPPKVRLKRSGSKPELSVPDSR